MHTVQITMLNETAPKGPGAIGKPLARSAERVSPFPKAFPELSVKNPQ